MSVRNIAVVFALISAGLSTAQAGPAGTLVAGEMGYVPAPTASTLSRDDVRRDLAAFDRNPTQADGGRFVGGEQGYVMPSHAYALKNGELVCVDGIQHNAKPEGFKNEAERRAARQRYPA